MRAFWPLLTLACAPAAPVLVDATHLEDGTYFVALLSDADVPIRISNPFGMRSGTRIWGELPQLRLVGEERRLVLIRLPEGQLGEGALEPPLADMRLERGAPPLQIQLMAEGDNYRMRAILPLARQVFRIDGATGSVAEADLSLATRLASQLTLSWLSDPEHCRRPGQGDLVPWGASPAPFAPEVAESQRTLLRVVHLGQGRLLAAGGNIYLIEKGTDFVPRPGRMLSYATLFESLPRSQVVALSLDPRPHPQGQRVIGLGVSNPDGPRNELSFVWEIIVGDTLSIRTATVVTTELRDLVVDAQGRWAAVAVDARVLLGQGDSIEWKVIPQPPTVEFGNRILWVPHPDFPLLVGTRGALHLWHEEDDLWWSETATERISGTLTVTALAHTQGEALQLWAGATRGNFFHKNDDEAWRYYELPMPPRYAPCGASEIEGVHYTITRRDWLAAVGDSGYVYLAPENCRALVQLRAQDGCLALFKVGDQPIEVVAGSLQDLDFRDGELVGVTVHGEVWMSSVR